MIMASHEIKLNERDLFSQSSPLSVVESFGIQKYSKLVAQINDENADIKQNTLEFLINELLNQESLVSCIKEDLIESLLTCLNPSQELKIRILGAKVLNVICISTIGCMSIIDRGTVKLIVHYANDTSDKVMEYMLQCLCYVSSSCRGPEIISQIPEAIPSFVTAMRINDQCHRKKRVILQTLYNLCSGREEGFTHAIKAGAVAALIDIINSTAKDVDILASALRLYALFCFNSEVRNELALSIVMIDNVFKILLSDSVDQAESTAPHVTLQSAALLALVALTIDSRGKKIAGEIMLSDSYSKIIFGLLSDKVTDFSVQLNVLKLLTNVAVYLPIRTHLLSESRLIQRLVTFSNDSNEVIAKHASITLEAIHWIP